MRETVDKYGRIDVLLNNAAIYVTQKLWKGPVEELTLEEWDRVLEVNLKGVFLCSKAVIPIMKKQKAARSSISLRALSLAAPATCPTTRPPRAASWR